jgi:TM2 domain.
MDRAADRSFTPGPKDYTVTWILLTFFGVLGFHRMYLGKWISGLIYLCTGGLCGLGYLYDLWTVNEQIDAVNSSSRP